MKWWIWMAALALALGAACDSDDTRGDDGPNTCNTDPWSCPSGQTCWPDMQGDFMCLNSGPGAAGDSCQLVLNQPTCSDGLLCFMLAGQTQGVCTQYCDPTNPEHACPDSAPCRNLILQSSEATFQACEPPQGTGGGGGAGGAGTGGAGPAGGSGGTGA
jgi:hypothetical protein